MTLRDYATRYGTRFEPCAVFTATQRGERIEKTANGWNAARTVYVHAGDCPDLWALFHLDDYRVTSAVSGPGYYLTEKTATA